jgi:hypothetical protein
MKARLILIMTFGLLVALLIMNDLPQIIINHEVTSGYAMGTRQNPIPNPIPNRGSNPGPRPKPSAVPEPSSLMLMGSGVAGVGIYLFIKKRNKKK